MSDDAVTFSKQQLEMNNLLIQLTANVANITADIKDIKSSQLALATQLESRITAINTSLEPRIRNLEDNMTKLLPIPSVSHETLVKQVTEIGEKITSLDLTKSQVLGGWKALALISGTVLGLANFLLMMSHLLNIVK